MFWGFCSYVFEDSVLLGFDVASPVNLFLTLRRYECLYDQGSAVPEKNRLRLHRVATPHVDGIIKWYSTSKQRGILNLVIFELFISYLKAMNINNEMYIAKNTTGKYARFYINLYHPTFILWPCSLVDGFFSRKSCSDFKPRANKPLCQRIIKYKSLLFTHCVTFLVTCLIFMR